MKIKYIKHGNAYKNMRKIFLAVLLYTIFLATFVEAKPIEISVSPNSTDINFGNYAKYEISIKNNQDLIDDVVIMIDGQYFSWSSIERYYMEIQPKSIYSTSLNVYPQKEGTFVYYITAMSLKTGEKDSETIYVNVKKPKELSITGFSAEEMDGNLRLNIGVFSEEKMQLNISFDIKDSEWKTVLDGSFSQEVEGNKNIVKYILLPKMLAGEYLVTITINKNLTADTKFIIKAIKNIVESEKINSNPFFKGYLINVENKGNVIEDVYVVKKECLAREWVSFSVQPSKKYRSGDKTIYEWEIKDLKPDQSVNIVFRIEYWPVYILCIIVSAFVIAIIGFIISRASRPRIIKIVKKKGDKDFLIMLEVKGPLIYSVTDVLIRDSLTPMAKVLKTFHGMEPVVRETENETELVWKLNELKPKDERIFSYMIKPVIGAHLKMPRAYIRFRTKDGKKLKVYSNHVFIETHH